MGKQGLLIELPPIDQTLFEEELYSKGVQLVAGVDEVGRGCLAGPVVSACVILPRKCSIKGIDDSKKLSPKERERLHDLILQEALAYGVGVVSPQEIDKINILQASLKSMKIAIDAMQIRPDYLLVDGKQWVDIAIPQKMIIKGDARSISVGAASIVAKVTRDRMMCDYEKKYPQYSFSVHKGYGTKAHLNEINLRGPTPIHRMTFAGVLTDSPSRPNEEYELSGSNLVR